MWGNATFVYATALAVITIASGSTGGCEIPNVVEGSLKEERSGDWYWNSGKVRWERHVNYSTVQSGKTVPSGTILWLYCNSPSSVHGNGKQRVELRCLEGKLSTELQCLLDGERLITSTAISTLRWLTRASGIPRSHSGITAEYSLPSTTPKFIEWTSSVSVEGNKTEAGGCEIPNVVEGSLKEERPCDWYWNWGKVRWERHVNYSTIQSGKTVPSGTELWLYCNSPFSVHGNGKQRVQLKCLEGRLSTELQCLLDGERLVTSTATSTLNRLSTVSELPRNNSGSTAEYSSPSTTPKFVEWTSSISVVGNKPELAITSPPSQEPPANECFCEYTIEDINIVAYVDGRRLIYRDRVRNGSTILFHCLHVGYHRLRGHREITCKDCQPWDSSDLPFCMAPEKGDAAILFNKDISVLPNGNIEILKGQNVNFTCVAMEIAEFPEWIAPETPGISFIRERRVRIDYGDVVYLTHLQIQNADQVNEGTYECSIDGNNKAMLQVIITDPNLRCPELPEDGRIIIQYSMERRENSQASFSCSKKGQELIGRPVLTCLRSGQWSHPPPYCSDAHGCQPPTKPRSSKLILNPEVDIYKIGEKLTLSCPPGTILTKDSQVIMCMMNGWTDPILPDCKENENLKTNYFNCPEFPNSPEVKVTYSKDLLIGSIATFECSLPTKYLIGSNSSICQENISWSNPLPSCAGVQRCLLNLDPSSHLVVHPKKDSYRMGEFIFLSCPPGEEMSKKVERLMCMGDRWSDSLPACNELGKKDQN